MIDTHCHLNFSELGHDLPMVLDEALAVGVKKIIVPGTNAESSTSSVNLSEIYEHIFAGIGVHPCDAEAYSEQDRKKLNELLSGVNSVVAIGEVGLDHYHFEDCKTGEEIENRKSIQRKVFAEMISLAKDFQLPLIVHSRYAFAESYEILKTAAHPAVIHCFTGTQQEADQWIHLGCLLSFTGIITYKKNQELRDIVKSVPLEKMMIETDAPFLPPEGHRGEICAPKFVREVAQCIADVKGISFEVVDRVTTLNAEQFFKI